MSQNGLAVIKKRPNAQNRRGVSQVVARCNSSVAAATLLLTPRRIKAVASCGYTSCRDADCSWGPRFRRRGERRPAQDLCRVRSDQPTRSTRWQPRERGVDDLSSRSEWWTREAHKQSVQFNKTARQSLPRWSRGRPRRLGSSGRHSSMRDFSRSTSKQRCLGSLEAPPGPSLEPAIRAQASRPRSSGACCCRHSFLRSPEQKFLNTPRTNSPAHTVAAGRSDVGFSLVYRSNTWGVPCCRKAVSQASACDHLSGSSVRERDLGTRIR